MNHEKNALEHLELGKPTEYCFTYSPQLLQPVPRALNREELGVANSQPFYGEDVWYGYELSWLNSKGKPVVRLAKFVVPSSSPNIIESKSFKLYLNSFNQSKFEQATSVVACLEKDLSNVAGAPVSVVLFGADDTTEFQPKKLPGTCLDDLDIEISDYQLNAQLLAVAKASTKTGVVHETLHSHLLKSNCLITNQPDWASVVIEYQGQAINHEDLLRYLISYRMHNEFHEQCVERIFMDLYTTYKLEKLCVQALYTRRGGLDINPYRSTEKNTCSNSLRINRQ